MIRADLGRHIRYWYTYRTVVAVMIALILSGVIYWLYTQQVTCDAHLQPCIANVSVHPEDRLFANQEDPGPGVVIVGVDDKTLQAFNTYPLPRATYAKALQVLQMDGAAVVGLDIEFKDRTDPADDSALAQALATTKVPVVLSYPASALENGSGEVVQAGTTSRPAAIDQIPLRDFRCLDPSADLNAPCVRPNPNVVLASTDLVLDADGQFSSRCNKSMVSVDRVTDVEGRFHAAGLPIGAWDINVRLEGFAVHTEKGVVLELRRTLRLDLALKLPGFGARPASGFWSARYCTITGPSVRRSPLSSSSTGT